MLRGLYGLWWRAHAVGRNKLIQEHNAVLKMKRGEGIQPILLFRWAIWSNGPEPELLGGWFKASDFLEFLFVPWEYLSPLLLCLGGTVLRWPFYSSVFSPMLGTPGRYEVRVLFIFIFLEPSPVDEHPVGRMYNGRTPRLWQGKPGAHFWSWKWCFPRH